MVPKRCGIRLHGRDVKNRHVVSSRPRSATGLLIGTQMVQDGRGKGQREFDEVHQ